MKSTKEIQKVPTESVLPYKQQRRFYLRLKVNTNSTTRLFCELCSDLTKFLSKILLLIYIFLQGMSGDAMMSNNGMAGVPHQGQVMIPNYSVFSGTPSHIVNMKTRSSIPTYLQENELRMDILKRQQICHAQVSIKAK